MAQPQFYSAVFAIIQNDEGEILFQKRQNTGFRDGCYQLPSGHLEGQEDIKSALQRETSEEIGVRVEFDDIEIVHIAHTISPDRVYFNIYGIIHRYSGVLANLEPEKCSEIGFFSLGSIQDNPLFSYEVETLEKIFSGEFFSEKMS